MNVLRIACALAMWPVSVIAGGGEASLAPVGSSVPVHYIDLRGYETDRQFPVAEIPEARGARFILIHGFRTPESRGLELAAHVGTHIHATMPDGASDELWALLWNSGGNNSIDFPGAVSRANDLGEPVSAILDRFVSTSDGHPVIVIAHSLGARVALSAMNRLQGPAKIDLLALVQPAVPYASIYDWSGKDVYNSLFDSNHPDPRRRIPWDTSVTPCEFASGIDRAARVIITQSWHDDTLDLPFEVGRLPVAEDCWPVDGDPALGRPFKLPPSRRVVYPGTPLPWEDMTRPSIRVIHGLDPFDIPEHERAIPELREPDAIVVYSFYLSHPATEFIDLGSILDVPPADWHSPLTGPSGRSLVAAIRDRLE